MRLCLRELDGCVRSYELYPSHAIVDSAARCLLPGTEQYQQGGRMPATKLSAVSLPVYAVLGSGFRVDLVPPRTSLAQEKLHPANGALCHIEPLPATIGTGCVVPSVVAASGLEGMSTSAARHTNCPATSK